MFLVMTTESNALTGIIFFVARITYRNVSNYDSQLSTVKTLANGQIEKQKKERELSRFRRCSPKGFLGGGGGAVFLRPFAHLVTKPQGLDSSLGDVGSLLGVSRLTESSRFYSPSSHVFSDLKRLANRTHCAPARGPPTKKSLSPRRHRDDPKATPPKGFGHLTSRPKLRCSHKNPGCNFQRAPPKGAAFCE